MRVTVLIDKREKRPLIFPSSLRWYPVRGGVSKNVIVKTKVEVMESGDYCLCGSERACLIERKASIGELSNNLFSDDFTRASSAFARFAAASDNPYLLLECTASELQRVTRWTKQPDRVMDALTALMARLKLRLLLCGACKTAKQKRVVGELVLRLMLAHSYPQEENYDGVDEALKNIGR